MKKNLLLSAVLLAGVLAFTACSKEEGDKDTFSSLSPEEHKQEIESEGIAFVQQMNAMADLSLYEVMNEFMSLMDQTSSMQVNKVVATGLNQIEAVRQSSKASVQLKQLVAEGDESFSALWAEEAGIYEWDSSISDWTYTEATDQITYKFTLNGEPAAISATNFSYQVAANQTEEGFVVELPNSLKISISLSGTDLCYYNYSGEWYSNDTPKLLEEEFYLEGYNLSAKLDLQNKSNLKTSSSFDYNGSVISASGFEVKGNIDYDAIFDELEGMEDGDIMAQDIVSSANAYFQIGNVKAEGLIDVEGIINDFNSADGSGIETEEDFLQLEADILNDNAKIYIRYADSNEIIAQGEIYVNDYEYEYNDYYTDSYVTETYQDLDMRMVFGDESAMSGDFFDSGFGDMINEINKLIDDMNTNYDMDIDPVQ
ncbi:hypothetical protein [Carboxylicivirga linearis]|uniref:DUF4878 domain-containing protein n=1 Tax=Carboxylicivirga linearis TaxID=1628157 RepID=A0ABS5JSL5_9BACT|nr:hypothetical protein [Carboxylicivirga linearis]MBS2097852.1 hypothetical protein [Carboxylicivirga linearis]